MSGGKVKQRTKGNTKPSSSGRAAELLSQGGLMGFVGFGNVSESSQAGSEIPDSSVHSDFFVVMKKLSKRDSITKFKAVQELGELCKTSETKDVLGMLKYWPRLYNKLSLDIDYRVRESTQNTMNQIMSRVGRNFAPHLKSVMGTWLCCQCDAYPLVATAAQKAFSSAFNEKKKAEVLGFCKKEIHEYLMDNILNQTAETLSDPDIVDEKDRSDKYIRVIASSLLALRTFLNDVNKDTRALVASYHKSLTSEKKFLKLGRHKSSQIRASFFSLISTYCEKLPTIIESCSNLITPTVLGSLDESDGAVVTSLWGAVLHLVASQKDCWSHVNMQKAVLPKLWLFLCNAAYGNAHAVMVSVLPLINSLPEKVILSGTGFAEKLLDKIMDGVNLPRTQQSPSECKAIMSAFMDCVNYFMLTVSKKYRQETNENYLEKLSDVVMKKLISVIEISLASKSATRSANSLIYERLSGFLHNTSDDVAIQTKFWRVFVEMTEKVFESSDDEEMKTLSKLLICLKSIEAPKLIQLSKVRFNEEVDTDPVIVKSKSHKEISLANVTIIFGGKLLAIVKKTVSSCLQRLWSKNSETDLVLVTELIKEFLCVTLLNDVVEISRLNFNGDEIPVENDVLESTTLSNACLACAKVFLLALFDGSRYQLVEKWLGSAVELLLKLLVYMEEIEQRFLLRSLFEINSTTDLLFHLVSKIFDAEYYLYLSYVHGVHIGTEISNSLKNVIAKSNCEMVNDTDMNFLWNTLDLCFSHSNLLHFLLNDETLEDIFDNFHHILMRENGGSGSILHSTIKLVEKYLKNNTWLPEIQKLTQVIGDVIHLKFEDETYPAIIACWDSLIDASSTDEQLSNIILWKTAEHIRIFLSSDVTMTFETLSTLTASAAEIVGSITERSFEHLEKFLKKISPSDKDWERLRDETRSKSTWAMLPFTDGQLSFMKFPSATSCSENFTKHHRLCLFLSHVLEQQYFNTFLPEDVVMQDELLWKIVLELLWMNECLKHDGRSKYQLQSIIESNLEPFLSKRNLKTSTCLINRLLKLSISSGGLWSLTLKAPVDVYDEDISITHPILIEIMEGEEESYDEGRLQTLQCLLQAETCIYNLKFVVEHYIKILSRTDGSNLQGQMFCYCVLSCAFKKWIILSEDSEIASLECRVTLFEVLVDFKARQNDLSHLLFFNCPLNDVGAAQLSLNLALIQIMVSTVANFPEHIDNELWDTILCSMLDWLQGCQESNLKAVHVCAMTNHVCKLLEVVAKYMTQLLDNNDEQNTRTSADEMLKKLSEEWQEFFSISAHGNLLRITLRFAESFKAVDHRLHSYLYCLSESLSIACAYLNEDNLKEFVKSDLSENTAEQSSWEYKFLEIFIKHINSSFGTVQLAIYRLFLKVMPSLVIPKEIQETLVVPSDERDDPCRSPPSQIMEIIRNGRARLFQIFSEVEVPFGETLHMENDDEALHVARSFFFSWKLLLLHFSHASQQLRAEYANYLQQRNFLSELLEALFRVLPKKPRDGGLSATESTFTRKEIATESFVHCLALETYYNLLRTLPALVRHWWNGLEKKYALIVERYTTSHIAHRLVEAELHDLQKAVTSSYDNMEIVTRSSTREVIAFYRIEDISIELIVCLPSSYPLGLINVNCGKRVGVKLNQWRLWMMQLTTFLMHQLKTQVGDGLV
ncbi:E3 ubiquitin-protein ligase listerin-like isoform X2 [Xenia sp. Carnegie-2017]|uniref:E3 ubiquitin-protein ligase listerin-like isoform X2 n=1 Tax=Xenia sp. Carnegie-2017 TaxID=2897299 RepID=UPI001F04C1BF|nr:E3 ubiquitin-protein ligase listerin-like isoform X2 [Xenia sp. Carnegie-2017]